MRPAALILLAACAAEPERTEVARFPAFQNPELDILFVVDNSVGMPAAQVALVERLATFSEVFAQLDTAPSLHLGVVTSDMGTQTSSGVQGPAVGTVGIGGCQGTGDDGKLFQTFSDSFDHDPGLQVGGTGCGFEQHLAAMKRGLTNPSNAGLLRAEANLAVVVLADEDDCSVSDPSFFADVTGQSFKCTQTSLICDEQLDEVGVKHGCRSNPGSTLVDDISSYATFLHDLKGDRVTLSSIVGDPANVSVELLPPPNDPSGVAKLVLAHACDDIGVGIYADPGVRLAQLAASLGGVTASICDRPYTDQVSAVAHSIKRLIGEPCLPDGATDCVASSGELVVSADPRACPDTTEHLRATVTGGAGDLAIRCVTP